MKTLVPLVSMMLSSFEIIGPSPVRAASPKSPTAILKGLPTTPARHWRSFRTIAFSPDSKYVATGCSRLQKSVGFQTKYVGAGEVVLWDTTTGAIRFKKVARIGETDFGVNRVFFGTRPNELWVDLEAHQFLRNRVAGWSIDWKTVKVVRTWGWLHCLSADGKYVISGLGSMSFYTTNPIKYAGSIFRPSGDKKSPHVAACDPRGKLVAIGSSDHLGNKAFGVATYDLATKKKQSTIISRKGDVLRDIAYDRSGRRLAILSGTGQVYVYNNEKGRLEGDFATDKSQYLKSSGAASQVRFHPDSRRIAVVGKGGVVQFRDLTTGKVTETFSPGKGKRATALAISPDGKLLGAVCASGEVVLWELK